MTDNDPNEQTSPARPEPCCENIAFWNEHRSIPKEHQKPVGYGKRQYTTWDATWAKRECTLLWGPYGDKWGLQKMIVREIPGEKGAIEGMMMSAEFFCPLCKPFTILNDMAYNRTGETLKKLQTNTLKKALSMLGFAADLYLGQFEDDEEQPVPTDPKGRKPSQICRAGVEAAYMCESAAALDAVYQKAKTDLANHPLLMGQVTTAINARRRQLEQGALGEEADAVFDGKDDRE